MRLGDLVGKYIVNIYDGARLGTVGESDLVIHTETGEIEAIVLPNRSNLLNIWVDRQNLTIPWTAVKKIGREVIIVDLDQSHLRFKRFSY